MTYLHDIAEQTKKYKVITYTDHRPDDYVAYYDTFADAFVYYKGQVGRMSSGRYTAGAALIDVQTGDVIHRQNWRL